MTATAAEPRSILLVPKDALDTAGRALGSWADSLGGWLAADFWGGISAGRLMATGAVLLLLWAFVALLLHLVVRRTGGIHDLGPRSWPRVLISAARKPVALLLVIFGAYLALVPSIDGVTDRPTREAAFLMFSWLADAMTVGVWFWLVLRVVMAVERKMDEWAKSIPGTWRSLLVELAGGILRVSAPLLAAMLMLPLLQLPPALEEVVRKAVSITLIVGVAGLVIRGVSVFQTVVLARNRIDISDNLKARKISTQVRVVAKVISWVVSIVAVGSVLMVFDSVRQLGTSILASAGIAGIILGFAAQRTLGNLLAGIQIAIAQPIRFDDVLIIEGQFGRVEEINLTYVTLKLWDLRRLVVPVTYFFEKPFENWTRTGSKILGTAFLYLDPSAPVAALREELRRVVAASPLWDGEVCGLQVTDCKDTVIEVRCLVSARDAAAAFDLRCLVRESMLEFVAREHTGALPRTRIAKPDREVG